MLSQLLHLLHHHHHQLSVYASATTRLPSAGGVTREAWPCTISFPYSLAADARLECIPLYTSSNPPPALPSQHTLRVEALVSLDPPAAHSAHPQSWPLRPRQPCSMRLSPHLAPGPPSRPTSKRRDTTTRMAKALSIHGTRILSVGRWNYSAPWHGDHLAGR